MNKNPLIAKVRIKPITVNRCWQGRRFKTKTYRIWREMCLTLLLFECRQIKKVEVACSVKLIFHCSKNFRLIDIDNMIKPSLDSIVEAGILKDDRIIEKLIVDKVKDTEDFWEFSIEPI